MKVTQHKKYHLFRITDEKTGSSVFINYDKIDRKRICSYLFCDGVYVGSIVNHLIEEVE